MKLKRSIKDSLCYSESIMYILGLSRRSWSPATTGPPGSSATNYVAVDGPPRTKYGCHEWSALPQVVPLQQAGKTVAAATNRPIDLYILTGEFEVTIKIFRNT